MRPKNFFGGGLIGHKDMHKCAIRPDCVAALRKIHVKLPLLKDNSLFCSATDRSKNQTFTHLVSIRANCNGCEW